MSCRYWWILPICTRRSVSSLHNYPCLWLTTYRLWELTRPWGFQRVLEFLLGCCWVRVLFLLCPLLFYVHLADNYWKHHSTLQSSKMKQTAGSLLLHDHYRVVQMPSSESQCYFRQPKSMYLPKICMIVQAKLISLANRRRYFKAICSPPHH